MGSFVTIVKDNEHSLKLLSVECSKRQTHCKYLMPVEFTIFTEYLSELNDKTYVVKR